VIVSRVCDRTVPFRCTLPKVVHMVFDPQVA
jgi:hypothetical protein